MDATTDIAMETTTAASAGETNGASSKAQRLPVSVHKLIPYTFDLGNLLCNDANPLPDSPTAADLSAIARDCAQALINQLLTTGSFTASKADGVLLALPAPTTPLPREKPLPAEKQETRWERFARKKGIKDRKRGEGKLVYDEAKGEWVPGWGYKGKNKGEEGQWLVEVDERKERALAEGGEGKTVRGEDRRQRVERGKRNERKMRANERKGRKAGAQAGVA